MRKVSVLGYRLSSKGEPVIGSDGSFSLQHEPDDFFDSGLDLTLQAISAGPVPDGMNTISE
jgi:hypothetical protein